MTADCRCQMRAFSCDADAEQINRLAVAAFEPFAVHYNNWPAMVASLAQMSALWPTGEIIVAFSGDTIAGAVAYIPPGAPKPAFFDINWPIIRMLVVDQACRGQGIGRALTDECLTRARRDGANLMALHTSPIMSVALPMYLRMGFSKLRDAPPVFGVEYAVYTKAI